LREIKLEEEREERVGVHVERVCPLDRLVGRMKMRGMREKAVGDEPFSTSKTRDPSDHQYAELTKNGRNYTDQSKEAITTPTRKKSTKTMEKIVRSVRAKEYLA
jgi:hypothetical protein